MTNYPALAWLGGLLALVAAEAAAGEAAETQLHKPNIVLILGDDQGWSDYGFMGSTEVATPHLDRLAARSLVYERGYVPAPLCRPSLASIATGLYPQQHGVVANDVNPKDRVASDVPVREVFHRHPSLIKTLVAHDYLAFQTGKWWEGSWRDGGFTDGMTHGDPTRGGRHGDVGLDIGRKGMQPIADFLDKAVTAQKPFFIWYAPFLPHTPHNPPAEILAKYQRQGRRKNVAKYYAMCEWFDRTCGELLGQLERRDLRDDTMVIYVCDNGWAPFDPTAENPEDWWPDYAPRSKGSPFELGIRTPIMISWPGHVSPARANELACSLDLFPTVVAACGINAPPGLAGINLLDAAGRTRRDAIFGTSHSIHNMVPGDPEVTLQYQWCVAGRWKLLLRSKGLDTTRYQTVHGWDDVPVRLYDLRTDPSEAVNLAARPEHAERVRRLRQAVEAELGSAAEKR